RDGIADRRGMVAHRLLLAPLLGARLRPDGAAAQRIGRPMHRNPPQPVADVVLAGELFAVPVQREKNILRDLLGGGIVPGDAQGDRKHHPLMGLDEAAEFHVGKCHAFMNQTLSSCLYGGWSARGCKIRQWVVEFCLERAASANAIAGSLTSGRQPRKSCARAEMPELAAGMGGGYCMQLTATGFRRGHAGSSDLGCAIPRQNLASKFLP